MNTYLFHLDGLDRQATVIEATEAAARESLLADLPAADRKHVASIELLDEAPLSAAERPLARALAPFRRAALRDPALVQALVDLERVLNIAASPGGGHGREASATLRAIAEVQAGAPVAPTARKHGLSNSTLFRALKRRRDASTPA